AFELKAEGKVKHVGLSFHDKAEVLEQILTEYPEIEAVQIQFNYADYDDPGVEGRKCYDVCRKFDKPIIVMEPVKGGSLVNLPAEARKILEDLNGGSVASYAIRFAASFEGIFMVLSGMGNMEMMLDNISYMKDFKPLNEVEIAAIDKVVSILKNKDLIPCTACRYCVDGCPANISIPDLFSCVNGKKIWENWDAEQHYSEYTKNGGKAKDCIACGKCEEICPQHLEIRELLKNVSKEFDNE
ncbi:MAG: aldo/keto reductase, partial [Clostridia bacterium]|nr:aldo/keto reductase [Clostridia bacterium]